MGNIFRVSSSTSGDSCGSSPPTMMQIQLLTYDNCREEIQSCRLHSLLQPFPEPDVFSAGLFLRTMNFRSHLALASYETRIRARDPLLDSPAC